MKKRGKEVQFFFIIGPEQNVDNKNKRKQISSTSHYPEKAPPHFLLNFTNGVQ